MRKKKDWGFNVVKESENTILKMGWFLKMQCANNKNSFHSLMLQCCKRKKKVKVQC